MVRTRDSRSAFPLSISMVAVKFSSFSGDSILGTERLGLGRTRTKTRILLKTETSICSEALWFAVSEA